MNDLNYGIIVAGCGTAGSAAALAVEMSAHDIRGVPISKLKTILSADDIKLDPFRRTEFAPHDT